MYESVFVFRTDDGQKQWLWNELRQGRLRQGWGIPGTNLFEDGHEFSRTQWIQNYNDAAAKFWKETENSQYAAKRFNILSLMRNIGKRSLLLVPKMPNWDTFVVCSPSDSYTFDASGTTPGNDYRHIIPVDTSSIRIHHYLSSEDSRIVKAKFRAYQSAVNNVYNAEMKEAVARLAQTAGSIAPTTLGCIYSDVEKEVLTAMKDKIARLPFEDLESIVRGIFESEGYSVERAHYYDREGGDADYVLMKDIPIVSDFIDDLATKIFVQIKSKRGKDYNDCEGVKQLIKINETEDNALRILFTTADSLSEECTNLAKANDIHVISGLDAIRMIVKRYNA